MAIKGVQWIIGFLVLVVIIFYLVSFILPEAQIAGDSLGSSSAGSCGAVGCVWNSSGSPASCMNMTSIAGDHTDTGDCGTAEPTLPLSSLFASSGIVFILIAIAVLLFVIGRAKFGKK